MSTEVHENLFSEVPAHLHSAPCWTPGTRRRGSLGHGEAHVISQSRLKPRVVMEKPKVPVPGFLRAYSQKSDLKLRVSHPNQMLLLRLMTERKGS